MCACAYTTRVIEAGEEFYASYGNEMVKGPACNKFVDQRHAKRRKTSEIQSATARTTTVTTLIALPVNVPRPQTRVMVRAKSETGRANTVTSKRRSVAKRKWIEF
jgi:hypothetical protein